MSRSPLSVSVGDSEGLLGQGNLDRKCHRGFSPLALGLCAWNLTINPAFAPQALEVVFHSPPPAFASAGQINPKLYVYFAYNSFCLHLCWVPW